MEYKEFKKLTVSSMKPKVKFDLDMFYKGDVVYPIRFMQPKEVPCVIEAFKTEDDKIEFHVKGEMLDGYTFDNVEDCINAFLTDLEIENKGIKDIKVGFPKIEKEY